MNENQKTAKEIPVKLLITIVLFLAALFLFAVLAKVVVLDKKDLFDAAVFYFLSRHTTPALIAVIKFITFFGSINFLLPAFVVLVVWLG